VRNFILFYVMYRDGREREPLALGWSKAAGICHSAHARLPHHPIDYAPLRMHKVGLVDWRDSGRAEAPVLAVRGSGWPRHRFSPHSLRQARQTHHPSTDHLAFPYCRMRRDSLEREFAAMLANLSQQDAGG